MKLAVIGLGKMGMQIAEMLIDAGHSVIAYDANAEAIARAATYGATPAESREDVGKHFADNQAIVWLMIPSEFVDEELVKWADVLPFDSIIIDGGNSDFRKTIERAKLLEAKSISLIDVGTSGGILGRENGFSMMAGGQEDAFRIIEPLLRDMAKPRGGYQYFGPSGSGHYVKMVHNAIEYGMMESLAEGYRMLKEGPFENLDLAAAGSVWETGSIIASSLNALTTSAIKDNPELEGIDGFVAESGEARWALETAKTLGIHLSAIQASMDVRMASQRGEINFATKMLAAMRNAFGGHKINK